MTTHTDGPEEVQAQEAPAEAPQDEQEQSASQEEPAADTQPVIKQFPEPEKVMKPTDPEESDFRQFMRYYIWIPAPAGSEDEDISGWEYFKRYYLWIPDPATARAEAERRKADKSVHAAERVQHHGTATVVGHPPYMWVFGWLIVLTMIEVFPIFTEILYGWTPIPHNIWIPILLVLAFVKALLVALYYMHLKYDQPWLSWVLLGPFAFALFFGWAIVAS
jgi:caa(3)-type oxidase subunit IV